MSSLQPVSALTERPEMPANEPVLRMWPENKRLAIFLCLVQAGCLTIGGMVLLLIGESPAGCPWCHTFEGAFAVTAAIVAAIVAFVVVINSNLGASRWMVVWVLIMTFFADVSIFITGTPYAYFLGVAAALVTYFGFSRVSIEEPDA